MIDIGETSLTVVHSRHELALGLLVPIQIADDLSLLLIPHSHTEFEWRRLCNQQYREV